MSKENQEKKDITVAQVIESEEFKKIASERLSRIKADITDFEAKFKTGERIKSTPAVRFKKLGLLDTDNFINAYACILGWKHIDLPSTLRKAIKDVGNIYFGLAYKELTNKKKDE